MPSINSKYNIDSTIELLENALRNQKKEDAAKKISHESTFTEQIFSTAHGFANKMSIPELGFVIKGAKTFSLLATDYLKKEMQQNPKKMMAKIALGAFAVGITLKMIPKKKPLNNNRKEAV